jgi:hypothetical protein
VRNEKHQDVNSSPHYHDDQERDNEMGGECGTHRRDDNIYTNVVGKSEGTT